MEPNQKIALFIDCENISSEYIDDIISELAVYGEVNIRKAYGNWETNTLKGWKDKRFKYGLESINQPSYSSKKNATDIKMTVDIMKILCQNSQIDIVALATSDSDFTPLVSQIREQSIQIIGFGEEKTSNIFQKACSQFVQLTPLNKKSNLEKNVELINLLKSAHEYCSDDNGFAHISQIGTYIKNKSSQRANNFGTFKRWGDILKELPNIFELSHPNNRHDTLLVKLK
jgi:uncharacterized protein (TIGR00288 family)